MRCGEGGGKRWKTLTRVSQSWPEERGGAKTFRLASRFRDWQVHRVVVMRSDGQQWVERPDARLLPVFLSCVHPGAGLIALRRPFLGLAFGVAAVLFWRGFQTAVLAPGVGTGWLEWLAMAGLAGWCANIALTAGLRAKWRRLPAASGGWRLAGAGFALAGGWLMASPDLAASVARRDFPSAKVWAGDLLIADQRERNVEAGDLVLLFGPVPGNSESRKRESGVSFGKARGSSADRTGLSILAPAMPGEWTPEFPDTPAVFKVEERFVIGRVVRRWRPWWML